MIYVILSYLLYPILYFLITIKKKNLVPKILVIQTAKIGDLICSTPIFREIKKKYPESNLTAMVNPIAKEIVEYNPYLDKIILVKPSNYKGFLGKIKLSNLIRKGNYDIVICLNPNVTYAITLFWALIPKRISIIPKFSGITFKLASKFFNYCTKHSGSQLITETYLKMLEFIDIQTDNKTKEVYYTKNADAKVIELLRNIKKPLIGIGVSSGNKLKELGIDKTAKLINALLENTNASIVFVGSSEDIQISNSILNLVIKKNRVIDTTGKFSLSELPALIKRLSLFIGVDSAVVYIAEALSIPIIHIAGPLNILEQHPVGKKVITIQKKISCVPCCYIFKTPYECKIKTKECIKVIEIEEIVNAAKKLLINGNVSER